MASVALESTSSFESSSETIAPRSLKHVTGPSFYPSTLQLGVPLNEVLEVLKICM